LSSSLFEPDFLMTPIKKPKILLLEELKHQLTQPSKNTTQDTNLSFLDIVLT